MTNTAKKLSRNELEAVLANAIDDAMAVGATYVSIDTDGNTDRGDSEFSASAYLSSQAYTAALLDEDELGDDPITEQVETAISNPSWLEWLDENNV